MTSVIVVTLFVLLIYPAIIPVNAPPVLKTLKDLFLGFAVFALAGLFVLTKLINAWFVSLNSANAVSPQPDLALLCVVRC